ncbi:zinc ABC transporter substrate-binding protein [Bacillus sp. H-16]|uniref:metal ABC transporter solute-binding protein, Zn/Mn family n=1 Tax=Alteribacter salitolerans TaxID=2912333 RepID=UPI001962D389|nr:zinc ABC transporter substrate-binding protein [Alteribacter salitolerans]MBM7097169.1 zinc ABC transporter substrate-binding protein [Alteribacter salitolerans]
MIKDWIKKVAGVTVLALGTAALAACGTEEEEGEAAEGLEITTSFSILGNIIEEVIGDRGSVEYIVPIGEEPHEYEPVPSDFRKVSDSDVFYVNGLGLEGWLGRIVSNVSDTEMIELADGVDIINLEGSSDEVDPHAWLSPKNGIIYVENLVEDLIERDPEGENVYRENAESYIQELEELDASIEEEVEEIPADKRVIVVSENAFKYFGEDYGFETVGIWEMNSHEEGTTSQINRVIDLVQDREISSVFVESTVDQRYMETVSNNANIPIAGEVYTDALGQEGSGAETYIDMLRHNAQTFVEGLKE